MARHKHPISLLPPPCSLQPSLPAVYVTRYQYLLLGSSSKPIEPRLVNVGVLFPAVALSAEKLVVLFGLLL